MTFDNRLLAFMHAMADTAGGIARRHWKSSVSVEMKADASPVTVADREIESALRKLIEAEFPGHGIVGEEYGNIRPDAEYQWVIDPIDGTRAFIANIPTFTTLIALAKDGVPIAGLIDQPVTGERWVGTQGKTSLNNEPVRAHGSVALKQAALSTTSTNYFSAIEAAAFEALKTQCARVMPGGDAYAYALLASGRQDIAVDAAMKPYDFCALRPVVEGAGGVITDWNGRAITLSSDGRVLAAANAALHRQALAILKAASV